MKITTMEKPEKNDDALLLRLPSELKAELQRQADKNGRRITSEINTRLRVSLAAQGPTLQGILAREEAGKVLPASYTDARNAAVHHVNDNGPANAFTDIDRAMLVVFHNLPPEKQLALLSLFR